MANDIKQADIVPVVGMGARSGAGSDCYAYTIVEVSKNRITVQRDDARTDVANGHDYFGNQKWILTPNPNAHKVVLSFRKKADCWSPVGSSPKYTRYYIGYRYYHQDPSF